MLFIKVLFDYYIIGTKTVKSNMSIKNGLIVSIIVNDFKVHK